MSKPIILATTVLLFGLFFNFTSAWGAGKVPFSEQQWADSVEATSVEDLYALHKKDVRYFNPWMPMKDKSFLDVLGWKLSVNQAYTAEEESFKPDLIPDLEKRIRLFQDDFIVWIGHNTFLVRIDGIYWLTDPIFTKRALLPARKTPPAIDIQSVIRLIKNVNIIVSHNHYDHLDRESMEQLPTQATVFVPLGLKDYVKKMNKPNVTQMDWWQTVEIGPGTRLVCLPAQHWSLRINQSRNTSLWASFLLITPKATLYFGGDSGYFKGFREIGKTWPGIDYAFIATTAYHPRWFMHYQHMNIPEAVKAFQELGARFFIPTQWGTFHLGDEPVGFPALDLKHYIKENNLDISRYKTLNLGEILPVIHPDDR